MLRSVVESFLDSVSEREFDSPLLAILAAQGFSDIHFTHGAFEFGKDVIAKRVDPETGQLSQYAIQAKAGDIGLGEWRQIRPQIEEAQENTLSHPNFDADLPRVAVLATTGRLVGGAILDAQQVAQRAMARGAKVVVWDRQQFSDWLVSDPELGFSGDNSELLRIVVAIAQATVREQDLEYYARNWIKPTGSGASGKTAIEAAVLANKLRQANRLDLAAYMALHLFRAAWSALPSNDANQRPQLAASAVSLFADYVGHLLNQARPKVNDPKALLQTVLDPSSIITYPVVCCRLIELFALLALIEEHAPALVGQTSGGGAAAAVVSLISHPGCSRPISDDFGSSIIAPVILLDSVDEKACDLFLSRVAKWIQDRYDREEDGLGLGSHGEPEDMIAERLLGAALESTNVQRRRTSYVAAVVLDLAAITGRAELYEVFRQNVDAYDIVPTIMADSTSATPTRNGPQVSARYRSWNDGDPLAAHHAVSQLLPSIDELLIASSTRSLHGFRALRDLVQA